MRVFFRLEHILYGPDDVWITMEDGSLGKEEGMGELEFLVSKRKPFAIESDRMLIWAQMSRSSSSTNLS